MVNKIDKLKRCMNQQMKIKKKTAVVTFTDYCQKTV